MKTLKKYFTINKILLYLCIPCMYILLSSIFECMRLPISFFNKNSTNTNVIVVNVASGILISCLMCYLTVVLKKRIERRRRKREIFDFVNKLEDVNRYLEKETGSRSDLFDVEWYKYDYSNLHEKYVQMITDTLNCYEAIKDLLTDKEKELVHCIKTDISVEPYNNYMDETEIDINYSKLKSVINNIRNLYNNVVVYVNKNAKNLNPNKLNLSIFIKK